MRQATGGSESHKSSPAFEKVIKPHNCLVSWNKQVILVLDHHMTCSKGSNITEGKAGDDKRSCKDT